jgi:hypothetical protein
MPQPMGPGDVAHINNAIDAMQTTQPSAAQRRRAALTVCDVLIRSGEGPATVVEALQALGIGEVRG